MSGHWSSVVRLVTNWGNSTKKEEMEGFYDLPELTEVQIAALKYAGYDVEVLDEKCWKGYEKKGMKTMFGKRYPNCVKKEEVEVVDEKINPALKGILKKTPKGEDPKKGGVPYKITGKMSEERERVLERLTNPTPVEEEVIDEAVREEVTYISLFHLRLRFMMMKMFFPEVRKPTKQEEKLEKVYPGCMVQRFDLAQDNLENH